MCLTACGGGHGRYQGSIRRYVVSDQPAPPRQQVLRRRLFASPRTLDPTLVADQAAYNVLQDLFEGLTTIGPGGRLRPGVASSWTISPDGRTYVFHLRPDARWSNGQPVTAGDFVYAWRREVNPSTAAQFADSLAPIVNATAIIAGKKPPTALAVTAIDADTLKVRLVQRTPYFLQMLFDTYYMPLYPPAIRKWGEAWTRPRHMVSDGPFKLTAWEINDHLTLKKNPYYWDAAHVRLREEIDYPINSPSSAVSRYLAGGLDLVDNPAFSPANAAWLRATLGSQAKVSPYFGNAMLGMLLHKKPFDSRGLRLAMNLTLNRRILAEKVSSGLVLPAYSLMPPLRGYRQRLPEWTHWSMRERLAVARRLYRAAGYSAAHPLRVRLLYPLGGVQVRIYIEALCAMWRQSLGADIIPWGEQWKVFLQDIQFKNAKLYWDGWIGEYPAPYTFFELFTRQSAFNYGGYDSSTYERAVRAALAEPDRSKRYAHYGKAEEILENDAPIIPLYFYTAIELVKPYVAGYKPNIMGFHLGRYIWIRRHSRRQP